MYPRNSKNNRLRSVAVRLLLLLSAGVSAPSPALESDITKPMNIRANSVEINDKTGISTYRGNVVIVQGSMKITADILWVTHNTEHKLMKIVAEGRPATYKQRPDNKDQDVRAQARRMEYFANRSLLVLKRQASLSQGGNVFKSGKILYNLKTDRILAGARQTKGNRVNITIEAKDKKPGKTKP